MRFREKYIQADQAFIKLIRQSVRSLKRFYNLRVLGSAMAILTATVIAPLTTAATIYNPTQIKNLAANFLADHYAQDGKVEIFVSNLDPRTGQKSCNDALIFEPKDPTGQGGNIHVQIKCDSPQTWSLYLPAQVSIYKEVPIAAQDLMRGAVVTLEDISYQEVNISSFRQQIITDINSLIGQEVKRNLGKGTTFTTSALDAPTVIRRNDLIDIETQVGSIKVTAPGIALSDGRLGQVIRAKNSQSDRILNGTVIASGRVRVK